MEKAGDFPGHFMENHYYKTDFKFSSFQIPQKRLWIIRKYCSYMYKVPACLLGQLFFTVHNLCCTNRHNTGGTIQSFPCIINIYVFAFKNSTETRNDFMKQQSIVLSSAAFWIELTQHGTLRLWLLNLIRWPMKNVIDGFCNKSQLSI